MVHSASMLSVVCRSLYHGVFSGLSCKPDVEMVRLLCPRCSCLYKPDKDHAHMDGAFWGREFAHFLFLTHPELRPDGASMSDKYVPR